MKQVQIAQTQEIKFEIVLMTPEWAERLLSHPENKNRHVVQSGVEIMALDQKAGKWVLTHQAIAVGPSGRVYDGQHRLWSIIKSHLPQKMVIATFVSDQAALEAMFACDRGRRRLLAGAIEIILGLDRGKDRVAVANVMHSLKHGTDPRRTDTDLSKIIVEYQDSYSAIRTRMVNKICKAPHAAAFIWMHRCNPTKVEALASQIASQEGLNQTEATIRRCMDQPLRCGDGRLNDCMKIIRGIEAALDGENLSRLNDVTDRVRLIQRTEARRIVLSVSHAAE